MQSAQNLLQNYQPLNKSEQQPESTNPHSDIAVLLWLRMAEIYGHLWVSNYGAKPNKSWCDMLATLSIAQIKHGLTLCQTRPDMPNLPTFKSLCNSMPDPKRFDKALPKPKADKAKVSSNIAQMRAILSKPDMNMAKPESTAQSAFEAKIKAQFMAVKADFDAAQTDAQRENIKAILDEMIIQYPFLQTL